MSYKEVDSYDDGIIIETELNGLSSLIKNLSTPSWSCTHSVEPEPGETLGETVTREIIGTQNLRSTPCPGEASKKAMEKFITGVVSAEAPIPILVPMGPKKPVSGEPVDLAELVALKTLADLNRRIKAHYSPGAQYTFREEDVTGLVLESTVPTIEGDITQYLDSFERLIEVLGHSSFMRPMRESMLTTLEGFKNAVDNIQPNIAKYLSDSDMTDRNNWKELESYKALKESGWKGLIPPEQREYYRGRYSYLYPERTPIEIDAMMSRYLASTLARYQLQAHSHPDMCGGFIQLNFAPPIPGIPDSLTATRVYYRTMPKIEGKNHLPFWRARGIAKPNGGESLKPSLVSWNGQCVCNRELVELKSNGLFLSMLVGVA